MSERIGRPSDERDGRPSDERDGRPSDERARLFLALELPDVAREALVRWREEALRGLDGLRLIAPEYLHATLCFLGWRSVDDVEAILAASGVLAQNTAPDLRLGEAIWLPPRRPRVLAVELDDPQRTLADAQAALAAALSAGGWYTPEKRPYLGHVTVARVARGVRAPRVELPAPPELALRAPHVTLYRSRLSPAGARYEPLGRVELGAR